MFIQLECYESQYPQLQPHRPHNVLKLLRLASHHYNILYIFIFISPELIDPVAKETKKIYVQNSV